MTRWSAAILNPYIHTHNPLPSRFSELFECWYSFFGLDYRILIKLSVDSPHSCTYTLLRLCCPFDQWLLNTFLNVMHYILNANRWKVVHGVWSSSLDECLIKNPREQQSCTWLFMFEGTVGSVPGSWTLTWIHSARHFATSDEFCWTTASTEIFRWAGFLELNHPRPFSLFLMYSVKARWSES